MHMIPNLTIIVAIYVVVGLLTTVAKQLPPVERFIGTRIFMVLVAIAGISLTVVATISTLESSTR